MDRRSFLDTLLWTSLVGTALTSIAPVPFFLVPPKGMMRTRRFRLGDVAAGTAKKVDTGDRVVIAAGTNVNVAGWTNLIRVETA